MRVSVVLPYFENARTLVPCLDSLMQQTSAPDEIIVVDDGSVAPARDVVAGQTWPLPVKLLETSHRGQSGATNVGIAAATGDVVVLTCADIIADGRLVEVHRRAHLAADNIAVIGHLPYADSVKMTPFMQYMNSGDVQFSFDKIEDAEDVSPFFCYAPNFSISRERLVSIGMFDERFVYGYQDTDLGVRLAESGVRFVYRSEAIGHHDHPSDVRAFVRRQTSVGEATLHWLEKYNKQAELRKMRLLLANYYPHIPDLEAHVREVERIERTLAVRPMLFSALKQDLFARYALISATSVAAGMARYPDRIHDIFGSSRRPAEAAAGLVP